MKRHATAAVGLGFLCLVIGAPTLAATGAATSGDTSSNRQTSDADKIVKDSADVVRKLSMNADTKNTLKQAKGIFIVPHYGEAALGVGGAGGKGVLVANNNGTWSDPAFYRVGSVSLGLQAGISGGSVAFFLMTDKAVNEFKQRNNFSLNADAGLSIINWSKRAQATAGTDVIAWSDTKGAYGNLAVNVRDIVWDAKDNQAYYGKTASAQDIISGKVQAPSSASSLKSEFSALESSSSSERSERNEQNEPAGNR